MNKILLLDNYDSFTYNLLHLLKSAYTGDIEVKRDYEIDLDRIFEYSCIIISPGPGNPKTTPMAMNIIKKCYKEIPILGICLGLQCINYFFNGKTIKAPYPIHGKVSCLIHKDNSIFNGIPQNIEVARYHSLIVKPGDNIVVTGWADNSLIMSIKHKTLPIYGLQFHPESFLSEYGKEMIVNFFKTVGLK